MLTYISFALKPVHGAVGFFFSGERRKSISYKISVNEFFVVARDWNVEWRKKKSKKESGWDIYMSFTVKLKAISFLFSSINFILCMNIVFCEFAVMEEGKKSWE